MAVGTAIASPLLDSGQVRKYPYRHRMGMVPSAEFAVFHDDFFGPVTTNLPDGWSAAIIDVGATIVTDTTTTHNNGVLLFDSDAGSEGAAVYMPKSVRLISGKRFFMEMRVKTEIADDSDVQFGLSDLTATTNPEDLWTTTAAALVAFGVLDGDATVTMLVDVANGGTSAQLGTIDLVSATWHTLAIYYNGGSIVQGYVDGNLALTWSGASSTIPTSTLLAPFFGFRNGSAATTEGHVDYVRWVSER